MQKQKHQNDYPLVTVDTSKEFPMMNMHIDNQAEKRVGVFYKFAQKAYPVEMGM